MAMTTNRRKITQRDLFKANPELRKAYAAEATRKSRERKRKEKLILSERNSLLENDKVLLKRRISSLEEELALLKSERESPNVALILEHEALSKAVKKHRVIFNEIKNTLEGDINMGIAFDLTTSGLSACFDEIAKLEGEVAQRTNPDNCEWQIFCPEFSFPVNRGLFDLNKKYEILFREESLENGDKLLSFRFSIGDISSQAPLLHDKLWSFFYSGGFSRSYKEIIDSLCSPKAQSNLKANQSKQHMCSDERPNRTFVTEMDICDSEDELFLTAETLKIPTSTDNLDSSKYFIIRTQLGQAALEEKIVQERLNKPSLKQERRNLIEAVITIPSTDNENFSELTYISRIRVPKNLVDHIQLEKSSEFSFLMRTTNLFIELEKFITVDHVE